MSNAKKPTGKPYSLDRYRAEAVGEPFVLWLDDEKSIEIARPTGDVLLSLEEATSSREIISVIAGDKADELFKAVGGEDFQVLKSLGEDIQKHFGLGE